MTTPAYVYYRYNQSPSAVNRRSVCEFLASYDQQLDPKDISGHFASFDLEDADKWTRVSNMEVIDGWHRAKITDFYQTSAGYWKKYQDIEQW